MHVKLLILLPLILAASLLSCNTLPYEAISMNPIYGWVDGCADVVISGHGFGADVSATLGDQPLANPSLPVEKSLDWGYQLYGQTPVASAPGYADLVVTSGGESDTIANAYYYTACPAPAWPESLAPDSDILVGSPVTVSGCNMDGAAYVMVGDSKLKVSLEPVCSTARGVFLAPDMAKGTWCVAFYDGKDQRVSPDPLCDTTVPDCSNPQKPESGDTGMYDPCGSALRLTYGGAK